MNAGSGGSEGTPRERVSLARLVDEALVCYPFTAGEQDRIRSEGDDFELYGPPTLLIHVLHNLIKNALDGIHAAGRGDIRLSAESARDWNRLTVTDTGSGIAPEVLPRIFDEFFSLKGPGRGTGMGLPFCRRVMTELGGEIACRSVFGEYTRVELRFPPVAGRPDLDDVTPEEVS
jgi:signal transduction histidine kinase